MSDLREVARNRLLNLAGHFAHPVRVDAAEEIGPGAYLLKVRHVSSQPHETQVTTEELEAALVERGPIAALTYGTRWQRLCRWWAPWCPPSGHRRLVCQDIGDTSLR